jgi:hypothetical protein
MINRAAFLLDAAGDVVETAALVSLVRHAEKLKQASATMGLIQRYLCLFMPQSVLD